MKYILIKNNSVIITNKHELHEKCLMGSGDISPHCQHSIPSALCCSVFTHTTTQTDQLPCTGSTH